MNLFKNFLLVFILAIQVANAARTESEKREAQIKIWETAESIARVLAMPAAVVFGSLTGCEITSKTDTCPAYLIEDYKVYNDRTLSEEQKSKLIEKCSPRSQEFPFVSLNNPDDNLTKDCARELNKYIPWKSNFLGQNVETSAEKNLKKAFRKGIWGSLFYYRSIPAAYSEDGEECPTLELDLFGSQESEDYTFDKWYRGELIQTDLLDSIRTMNIKVGFNDDDACEGRSPVMYYSGTENMIGLCRDGAASLTSHKTLYITSTIIHEVRHSSELFGDSSSHDSECNNGDVSGCDKGEFGAYGAEFIFADQVIAGSKVLIDDLFDDFTAMNIIYDVANEAVDSIMCVSLKRIYDTVNPLYNKLQNSNACGDGQSNFPFLVENYGF